ncbi:MAG: phosphoribosylaminoimidazolesuccinocarboxamide synthase [Clostridia bacterium]|jgi:phosphoribosylaminoimidazole-succinocarboxamide synthase|nr:phosphoribosylaminoimidazolesuccinocarboxamide synthase [Clostridia bacterium]
MPEIRELIREGKGKRVYATDDPDYAVVYYKDEAMAFHGLKRGRILGKGEINNAICEHLFTLLEDQGVKTHFVRQLDARQSLVYRCDMMVFAVKIRNRVAGSMHTRTGLPVGMKLEQPVIEFCLKDSEMDTDALVNHTHLLAMKAATMEEINEIRVLCKRINEILSAYMSEINIELIDFRIEFGRFKGKILLADELSPDKARFWDSRTHEPLDIDRFRRDLGGVTEAYQEVLHRMMGTTY